jgi:hypothetical protein
MRSASLQAAVDFAMLAFWGLDEVETQQKQKNSFRGAK